MLWSHIKVITACAVLAAGALGVGGVVGRQTAVSANDPPPAKADPPRPGEAPPPDKGPPPGKEEPREKAKPPAAAKPAKPAEKQYSFSMENQPWAEVIQWLSDQTGLAYVSAFKPAGTFSFVPPHADGAAKQVKQYTITEIIDILNEALQSGPAQKYVLIRRERTLLLLPADEKIDPTLVPRVEVNDLGKRGKRELVKVMVSLRAVAPKNLAPDVKKMLGPFGEVIALDRANQLSIQDTAGNLLDILQMVQEAEIQEAMKQRDAKGR